jgi:hypothetical protein
MPKSANKVMLSEIPGKALETNIHQAAQPRPAHAVRPPPTKPRNPKTLLSGNDPRRSAS